jgi:hypothetical protein
VERHVDLWTAHRLVHSIHTGDDRGPRPLTGTGASGKAVCCQRQRIDMTSPATIAPKPIAKFHAPSETMNGIWSPAT